MYFETHGIFWINPDFIFILFLDIYGLGSWWTNKGCFESMLGNTLYLRECRHQDFPHQIARVSVFLRWIGLYFGPSSENLPVSAALEPTIWTRSPNTFLSGTEGIWTAQAQLIYALGLHDSKTERFDDGQEYYSCGVKRLSSRSERIGTEKININTWQQRFTLIRTSENCSATWFKENVP